MKKAWIQLLILLAVTFVFVPLVIENLLYRTLIGWGLTDIIAGNITGVMIAAALLTAGYLTTRSDSKGSWKERVGLRSFDRSHFPFLIKLSLLSFVIGVVCFLLSVWLGADLQNEKAKAVEESFAFFPLLVAFVGAVIISPIYEEIFYRGIMLSVLNRIASERVALFLQALFFTLAHLPNWNILLLTIINGYLFAHAYRKTGSVFAAAFVHGMVNLLIYLVSVPLIALSQS